MDLRGEGTSQRMTAQELQELCSSCPAVEGLAFFLSHSSPPSAFLPLLQLSGLTSLELRRPGTATAAAAVHFAVQLTGLKQLALQSLPLVKYPALLQLTALTALQGLALMGGCSRTEQVIFKARPTTPPDVWIQLLRHLLKDAACHHTLLKRSIAAASGPAELMLAATLAEELAATKP